MEYEETSDMDNMGPSIRPSTTVSRRYVVTSERAAAPTEVSFKGINLYCPPRQIKR